MCWRILCTLIADISGQTRVLRLVSVWHPNLIKRLACLHSLLCQKPLVPTDTCRQNHVSLHVHLVSMTRTVSVI